MKLTFVLMTVAFFQVHASAIAQNVNFTGKKVPLEKIFSSIKAQTGYNFFYNATMLHEVPAVTIEAKDMPFDEFLEKVFRDLPLAYTIENKNVIVFRKSKPADRVEYLLIRLRGRIRNKDGQPLPGASVSNKKNRKNGITDGEGAFTIDASEGDVLQVSFIGYEPMSYKVTAADIAAGSLSLVMDQSTTSLGEVTVNKGYYSESQRLSTSNVSKVTAKEIGRQPVTSPLLALQGRVPGLEITPQGGAPGAAPTVRVRGENSLRRYEGGFPLYVIDGVMIESKNIASSGSAYTYGVDPLININPENIESIEVLKDADATAIYGSRGANGVILITTKKAKGTGAPGLEASIYRGISRVPNRLDLLNREEYLAMRNEAYQNAGMTPDIHDYDMRYWDTTRSTDWQEVLLGGAASTTDAQLIFSGGAPQSAFRLTGGYHRETSMLSNDYSLNRGTLDFNYNYRSPDQRFSTNFSASYGAAGTNMPDALNLVSQALDLAPVAPKLYNDDGSLNWEYVKIGDYTYYTFVNPLQYSLREHEMKTSSLNGNAVLTYQVLQGLTIRLNAGYNDNSSQGITKMPLASYPTNVQPYLTGSSTWDQGRRISWTLEPQLDLTRQFGHHSLNILLGATMNGAKDIRQNIQAMGYRSDALLETLTAASDYYISGMDDAKYRYIAGFARIGYNWKEKYLLNLTGRRDGSSRFGPGNQFGNFGAVGAAWIISAEPFMKENLPLISFAKLRGSYGTRGNDQIGDYKYYDLYKVDGSRYQNNAVLLPVGLFNRDFHWEVTNDIDLSFEMAFWKDRLSVMATWFRKRSSNQLIEYQLPAATGFESIFTNFTATVENRGWEFVVQTRNVNTQDFSWSTSFNLSVPQNELIAFPGIESSPYRLDYQVGSPLSIQRLFKWEGVDPATGQHRIADLNGDGRVDDNDRQFGYPNGLGYYGGMLNSFRYKSISLSFLLQFSSKLGDSPYSPAYPGMYAANQPRLALRRWTKEGDITDIARFTTDYNLGSNYYQVMFSNYAVAQANFVKLKTLSLSVDLPGRLMEKWKLRGANFFMQGQNLLTFTDYQGLDPETGARTLPQPRMLTAGIQLKI